MKGWSSHPGACKCQCLGNVENKPAEGRERNSLSKSPESETTTVPEALSWSREVDMVIDRWDVGVWWDKASTVLEHIYSVVETRGKPAEPLGSVQGPIGFPAGAPICLRAQMRQSDHAAGAPSLSARPVAYCCILDFSHTPRSRSGRVDVCTLLVQRPRCITTMSYTAMLSDLRVLLWHVC